MKMIIQDIIGDGYERFVVVNTQCHLDKVFYDENSISYAVMH